LLLRIFMKMSNPQNSELKNIISNLPDKPGVYQFFDSSGKILYIGKAKSLKKRVSSYFNKIHYENNKVRVLVKQIREIKHIVVSTESDALLLENNLIKKYLPRYNINLKDDKTFPWICIKNEPFPRIFTTRNIIKDGSEYFGPYTSALAVKTLLTLIRELYPIRTCKYNLIQENIENGKFKVCLEYHLGKCLGPCEGLQEESQYMENILQIREIIKGNLKDVLDYLNKLMKKYADEFRFEEAQNIKNKLEILEKYQAKSTVVNPKIHNVDVFSIITEGDFAYVNFLKLINGSIIQAHTIELKRKLDESPEEMLEYSIVEIRERLYSNAKELILPFRIPALSENYKITIPKKGDKLKILELSQRNAKFFMLERQRQKSTAAPIKTKERILNTIKNDLRLSKLPVHIECFDNSNIQGTNPVAACVVFKNALPSKRDYRHYNIKSVTGADDFASMEEVVYRRYSRLIKEKESLPQLIVIDGGKGQLNAAVKSLEKLNLRHKIGIVGIAKRLEEIYFPDDPVPLYIDKNSESLKIIQQLRNEAHRFGINFHRLKRSKEMLVSSMDKIPGLGSLSVEKLISTFGSIENVKNASLESLVNILGKKRAKIVQNHFKQ
jgi:excinuclease ABC subunit C